MMTAVTCLPKNGCAVMSTSALTLYEEATWKRREKNTLAKRLLAASDIDFDTRRQGARSLRSRLLAIISSTSLGRSLMAVATAIVC